MVIGSRHTRSQIIGAITSFIPPVILSGIITYYFLDKSYSTFGIVFGGILCLGLAQWTIASIFNSIYFYFGGRKQLADQFLDGLKLSKYPSPGDYLDSPEDFFTSVMEDESLDYEVRVNAACDCATWGTLRMLGAMQQLYRINVGMEDALVKYKVWKTEKEMESTPPKSDNGSQVMKNFGLE